MNADEESRNRQYKGTAMSDDEVSKVYKILSFGICAKSNLKLKYSQIKRFICEYYFCFTLRCVLFRQSEHPDKCRGAVLYNILTENELISVFGKKFCRKKKFFGVFFLICKIVGIEVLLMCSVYIERI